MPGAERFSGDSAMTCEEFAMAGLDLGSVSGDSALEQAAREHLRNCPHCAALHENWQTLRADLQSISGETSQTEAPPRVEMRLRQDFRTKHRTMKTRRAAVIAAWSLAAAAALVAAVSLVTWRSSRDPGIARNGSPSSVSSRTNPGQNSRDVTASGVELGDVLVASNNSGDFTLLPGSIPSAMDDATVVHVEMQRAALGALGLTVNEEHADDWIQVDLLVGEDGLPQAVRLPDTTK
jgi:predicted anti-sigma-YlaC factor YlaD